MYVCVCACTCTCIFVRLYVLASTSFRKNITLGVTPPLLHARLGRLSDVRPTLESCARPRQRVGGGHGSQSTLQSTRAVPHPPRPRPRPAQLTLARRRTAQPRRPRVVAGAASPPRQSKLRGAGTVARAGRRRQQPPRFVKPGGQEGPGSSWEPVRRLARPE